MPRNTYHHALTCAIVFSCSVWALALYLMVRMAISLAVPAE